MKSKHTGTYRRQAGVLALLRPDPEDSTERRFRDDWNEHFSYLPNGLADGRADIVEEV